MANRAEQQAAISRALAILDEIHDPLRRSVAKQIFAPLGTSVPSTVDHAKAYTQHPDVNNISKQGGLHSLFMQDRQAIGVLCRAVNEVHPVYKRKKLDNDGVLDALGKIAERAFYIDYL